jgi:hypothetical protein
MSVIGIIFALLYAGIGVFFCGLMGERDYPGLLILFWPILFVSGVVLCSISILYNIGKSISEWGKRN